ncbi:hypothetical protein I4U23_012855 [Adineta vaga]|nr:hypothetical protein I4U23_012855 [Adineta vaga]
MSEIKPKESEEISSGKSSKPTKRKTETEKVAGSNDKKDEGSMESKVKKQKILPSINEQKKQLEKLSKTNEQAGPSDVSEKNYEDGFRKHPDLHLSYKLVYEPYGISSASKPKNEPESDEYGAFDFSINKVHIKFRVAKTTPTKVGQFVTLWKRIGKGPIMPYDINDPIDIYVICVREGEKFGQFIFTKSVLASQNILSKNGKGGKRAIRIYAPWVKTESTQATTTKTWQVRHFINLSDTKKIDLKRVRELYRFK